MWLKCQPDVAIAQPFVDPRVKREFPRRLGKPVRLEKLDRTTIAQRLVSARQRGIDPGQGIKPLVAVKPEMDIGIESQVTDLQRCGKQRAQSLEMTELHLERPRLLAPGKVTTVAVVDGLRACPDGDASCDLPGILTVQSGRQSCQHLFVPGDHRNDHIAPHPEFAVG